MFLKNLIDIETISELKKIIYKRVDFTFFIISVFILPISIKWSSKLLFIALALGILRSIYKSDFSWFYKHRRILTCYIIFVSYIFLQGLFIEGYEVFFKKFDKAVAPYLVFILVPVFFNKKEFVNIIPKVFLAGLFFLFLLILCNSFLDLSFYSRERVLEVFDIHHLYASLYILFAINYFLSRVLKKQNILNTTTSLICLVVLTVFLFIFKSKAAIVVYILLLIFYAFKSLNLSRIKFLIVLSLGLVIGLIFSKYLSDLYLDALNFRLKIWSAAVESFWKNPFTGYGALNEYKTLNYQHFLNTDFAFLDSNFNSHNQYLTLLLKFGILGLVFFSLPFVFLFESLNRTTKIEYIGFLILFMLMAYIESLLNRHHGIVFTAIMLYYFNAQNRNEI